MRAREGGIKMTEKIGFIIAAIVASGVIGGILGYAFGYDGGLHDGLVFIRPNPLWWKPDSADDGPEVKILSVPRAEL